jgi:hypothetical protein
MNAYKNDGAGSVMLDEAGVKNEAGGSVGGARPSSEWVTSTVSGGPSI